MALNKINIYGSRISNGTWQILADGGWMNASLLMGDKRLQADAFAGRMPTEYYERHVNGKAYTFDPGKQGADDKPDFDGTPKAQPKARKVPKGKPEQGDESGDSDSGGNDSGDSQGDDDSQGDGDGDGDGDDTPVWHSEFDPWAEKVDKGLIVAEAVRDAVETHAGHIGTLQDRTAKLERENQRISAEMTRIKVEGGGGGAHGSPILKVEVKMPNLPTYEHEGFFHHQFGKLMQNIAGGHHCYLPGPPGSGKSHAAKQVTDALGPLWRFGSLSLGPTTPESRLWGGRDANNNFHEPPLVKLARYAMETPEGGAVYCLDELDNGHPGIIATMNSAMANGWFEAPNGDLIEWGNNFVMIGSANTFGTGPTAEFSGRNRLDAATLDRFNFLPWETDVSMETAMVKGILHENDQLCLDWLDVWHSARRNVESHGLKVFVTMRGALRGAKMLAQGRDIYETAGEVLLNKLPEDQKVKVSPF